MPLSSFPFEASRSELRRRLRAWRSALPLDTVDAATEACAKHLASNELFRHAGTVAGYVAVGRELDPIPLLRMAHTAGKAVYLPRLQGTHGMQFVAWKPGDTMRANRFGILEPASVSASPMAADALDLVLVPLLGFDALGNRLGFGGGYYDRAFAFRYHRPPPPLLCGYAYAGQRCREIERAEWDIPLDAVVTEDGLGLFNT